MVRLASVEFTKLKNVRPGTRLSFPETGAVVLGKNGTGKTTLLQYLVALCTVDTGAFVSDESFDVSAVFRLGSGAKATLRLTGTPRPQFVVPVIEASHEIARRLSTGENIRLEYLITFPDRSLQYRICIVDGQAELSRNDTPLCDPFSVQSFRNQLADCLFQLSELVSQRTQDEREFAVLFSLALKILQIQEALCRYDEGLNYFRMLTDEDSNYLSLGLTFFDKKQSIPGVTRGCLSRIPPDLFEALSLDRYRSSHPDYLSVAHSSTAFMREFVRLCNFSGATVIAPIEIIRSTGDQAALEWKLLRFTFELSGNRISHAMLSFGQKRLLSYLYYLACNQQIGITDELVNGMHHEWIEYCLRDACAGRQMFYTSQNPLLLDFLTFESATEVSERLITCKWSEQDGFVWENLESRVSEEFYRLYKVGIQHVSDILRTRGWW
jgi:energy-coupling factor transporter ATP-binding protein EcfA2